MAKWTVKPESTDGSFVGKVEYGDSVNDISYEIHQDVSGILKEVELDKALLNSGKKKEMGWRKAFTIPDIVAIEIMEKYMLDVHDPMFMHDQEKLNKLKYIVRTEYPYLLIST